MEENKGVIKFEIDNTTDVCFMKVVNATRSNMLNATDKLIQAVVDNSNYSYGDILNMLWQERDK